MFLLYLSLIIVQDEVMAGAIKKIETPINLEVKYNASSDTFDVYGVIGNPKRIKLYSFEGDMDPLNEAWD